MINKGILLVFGVSMLKFLFAFPIAIKQNINLPLTVVTTSLGMMTTVGIIVLFKNPIKIFFYKIYFNKRNKFTKTNRRIISIYQKFGLWGIAFATPPLLTPIGGTLVAVTRGESTQKILLTMFTSSIVWGIGWGAFTFYLKDVVFNFFGLS